MTFESFLPLLRPFFGGTGFVLACLGGLLLFLPSNWLDALGLLSLRQEQRATIGLAFLMGLAMLIGVQLFDKESLLQRELRRRAEANSARSKKIEARAKLRERLVQLTPAEKTVLGRYIKDKETSIFFDAAHGVANGLEARSILYRTAVRGDLYGLIYNLDPSVREVLTAEPGLLEGAAPKASPFVR